MDRAHAATTSSSSPSSQRVRTTDGVEGVILRSATPAEHAALTHVRIFGDQSVVVPAELLHRQADGSFLIPLSSNELRAAAATALPAGEEAVIPVVREEVRVSKRERETGRVVVHVTPSVHDEPVEVDLAEEHVDVERVPVNQFVTGPVAVRQEGDVTIVPVLDEVLVVEKRLMLREEIRVRRRREVRHHVEHVALRTEAAHVLRADAPVAPAAAADEPMRQPSTPPPLPHS